MQKWEYRTEFVTAEINHQDILNFLHDKFPHVKNPPKHTPLAMIPYLCSVGEKGWELVHMEPVAKISQDGDVGFVHHETVGGVMSNTTWSNIYFCVFKRAKQE